MHIIKKKNTISRFYIASCDWFIFQIYEQAHNLTRYLSSIFRSHFYYRKRPRRMIIESFGGAQL